MEYGTNDDSYCSSGTSRCIESLLDIEYLGQVASKIPLSVYYSSTYDIIDWTTQINSDADAAYIQSVSYGDDEIEQSASYMERANDDFMVAGVKGVSIFIASGDEGVWGNAGKQTKKFLPDFPATSPYVTAVGGTNFKTKSTVGEEIVWSGGGGGFSTTFAAPSYQTKYIEAYFDAASSTLPPSSYYNASGRGYPDVAALGGDTNTYLVSYKAGSFTGVYGTSAATPVFAGVIGQLNNVRLSNGKSTLGFLNPWIYENQAAFNDVTSGTNNAGNDYGFTATAGWDPASGVGTPNYAALLKTI